jgi:uncharacterized membrane protein YkoI
MFAKFIGSRILFASLLALGALANVHASAQVRAIDEQEATRIALGHIAGTALKVERERDLDILYFEVAVRSDNGLIYDVNVAADDGRVLSVVLDD